MVDVAQLVRALVCGTRGRGFETHLPPLKCPFFFIERGIFFTDEILHIHSIF